MLTTSELFGDDDWVFTSERSVDKAPRNQKQTKSRETPHATLKKQNLFKDGEAVKVCSENQCFTGMVVALPLSLLAWAGMIVLLYLIILYFQ